MNPSSAFSYFTTTVSNNSNSQQRRANPSAVNSLWVAVLISVVCFASRSLPAQTLAQALDTPTWSWFGSGTWRAVSWPGAVGGSAAMVGGLGFPSSDYLSTTVTGPGTLNFSYAADGVYSYQLQIDGGPPVYLNPFQLSFISYSTPISSGSHTLTWYCSYDSTSSAALDNVSLVPSGPISPTITSTSPLPNGALGSAYNQTLSATGGITPYTWSIISGGLPAGLSLSTAGVISGNPSMVTNASFTAAVTGADGGYAYKTFALTIGPAAPSIGGLSPLRGTVGQYLDFGLPVGGSISPYTWSFVSGNLPPGISFSGGAFTGTPATVTNTTFTVQVTGGNGLSDSRAFDFMIGPAITNNSTLPAGVIGVAYSQSLMATGGVSPYT